ncbi:MAG: CAP64 protein product - [Tremellales sp. Tagirdzhanova-0007]|nr:MAG: CAP64 protein product - [Tremellales sp. Tagirdzhanova-0007]
MSFRFGVCLGFTVTISLNLMLVSLIVFGHGASNMSNNLPWVSGPSADQCDNSAGSPSLALPAALSGRQCSICSVAPDLCDQFGERQLKRAFLYTGTNARLRKMLKKLKSGVPFTIGVIGGSVSKGFGLNEHSEINSSGNLNRIVFDHLNELFPAANGVMTDVSGKEDGKNAFVNGAQGGTGTNYFAMCFKEHIPEDVDLVLIELAINDELLIQSFGTYELLLRGLLNLPNEPAIINMQVFALMFPQIATGGDIHQGVSQLYDIPTISMRNLILHDILNNSTMARDWFTKKSDVESDDFSDIDVRHISRVGHRLMADLVNAYIDVELCEMDNNDFDVQVPEIPKNLLHEHWNPEYTVPPLSPQCYSNNARTNKLAPVEATGWREWNWQEKHYLIADMPGSKVSFRVHTSLGAVQVHFLRSAQYGLGSVRCWVDDDESTSKFLIGYWDLPYNIGYTEDIARGLPEGEHMLHCLSLPETADPMGGTEFRLISVMTI